MKVTPLDVFHCALDGASLIEASAGTGKTWTICGLYLRLLLERGLDVQHILVVTFTNAATAELRERIRTRIAQALVHLRAGSAAAQRRAPAPGAAVDDPFVLALLQSARTRHGLDDRKMVLRLDQALQTFDEAAIFTIHGFCQRALADTPFAAGMPLAQELVTDDAALRLQIVHDFWRRHIASDTLAPALAGYLLDRDDTPAHFERLLRRQLVRPLARVRWPAALDGPAAAEAADAAALQAAHAAARRLWQRERDALLRALALALPRLKRTTYDPAALDDAAASWDQLLAADDAGAAPADLPKLDLLTPAGLIKGTKKHQTTPTHPFCALAGHLLDLHAARSRSLARERLRLLRRLLTEGPAALRQARRERRVVAFDDMLYNLHARLTDGSAPWLAGALRARFPAALIDEFQDTDPLQFEIFRAIHGDGSAPLFMVGDPKQAIYSFRGADLHAYLRARDLAQVATTLTENQRSTAPLLGALNALFGANPRAFMLDGLDYRPVDPGAKRRKVLVDRSAPRAPLQLWSLPRAADGAPMTKAAARHAAGGACAGEIARLLQAAQRGAVTLDDEPLAAGDIAILVRSHAQGSLMRQALARLNVGSVELSQESLYDSPDAAELQRLLAAILEPARDRLLRTALATRILGHDAGAIAALVADEARLLAVVARFAGYLDTWLAQGVGAMLRQLFVREGVSERLLACADGERRLTNLLHLAEVLQQAAQRHPAPEALLRWLQAQRDDPDRAQQRGDDAAQLRLESDRNLVHIITVHRAKGLEYPIVFCPFLWDGYPGPVPDLEGQEYHDAQGRFVIDFREPDEVASAAEPHADPDPANRAAAHGSPDPGGAIAARIALERAAENLRLVYVALTRAVHRCVLVVGAYRLGGKAIKTTECTRGVLNWLVAGAPHTAAAWLENKLEPAQIEAAWAALAAAHAPRIGLDPLPTAAVAPVQRARVAPETLAALAPPRRIPAGWWIGSYSSLAHGARHEGAASDHDLRATLPAAPRRAAPAGLADDDILRFPRGAAAGECVHAVFERIDFTAAAGWPEAIAAALHACPPPPAAASRWWPRMLLRMLHDVMHAPLPGGATLAAVPRARRLVELEFSLPAGPLQAGALAALLEENGYGPAALAFGTLHGYLRGFIDLVFEHAGRYMIVDWKSNHLGDTPADYGAAALAGTMQQQGYHLQHLLYTVAVHRTLQRRLPAYRYDTHFGGVLYLFVRGVRPGWTNPDGSPAGVYAHRPALALVERLSAMLGPARVAA